MIKFQDVKRSAYDIYRTEIYDPAAKITPGQAKLLRKRFLLEKETSRSRRWTTSPSRTKPPGFVLKNASTTIESHGLGHMTLKHVIDNLDLDKIQRGWLYKILQDTIQAPQGKSIVTKHIDDKDTRKIWEELSEYYSLDVRPHSNPVRSQRT
jgi:hypothetical protein